MISFQSAKTSQYGYCSRRKGQVAVVIKADIRLLLVRPAECIYKGMTS
jgi:hypothetical protein